MTTQEYCPPNRNGIVRERLISWLHFKVEDSLYLQAFNIGLIWSVGHATKDICI